MKASKQISTKLNKSAGLSTELSQNNPSSVAQSNLVETVILLQRLSKAAQDEDPDEEMYIIDNRGHKVYL